MTATADKVDQPGISSPVHGSGPSEQLDVGRNLVTSEDEEEVGGREFT